MFVRFFAYYESVIDRYIRWFLCKHKPTNISIVEPDVYEQVDNTSIYGDTVNIVESNLYIDANEAKVELRTLQEKYIRQEWCIDQYTVDKVLWQEGFVKV